MRWEEQGRAVEAAFVSLRGGAEPRRAVAADDTLTTDAAFRLVSQGTAIVWRGDFVNGRQLLAALGRRVDGRLNVISDPERPEASFHSWRQVQAQRANMLSLLLVPVAGASFPCPARPRSGKRCGDALGELPAGAVMPIRDVLTALSAAEWHRKGVPVRGAGWIDPSALRGLPADAAGLHRARGAGAAAGG